MPFLQVGAPARGLVGTRPRAIGERAQVLPVALPVMNVAPSDLRAEAAGAGAMSPEAQVAHAHCAHAFFAPAMLCWQAGVLALTAAPVESFSGDMSGLTCGQRKSITGVTSGLSCFASGLTCGLPKYCSGVTSGLLSVTSGHTCGLPKYSSGVTSGLTCVTSGLMCGESKSFTSFMSGLTRGLTRKRKRVPLLR